MPNMSNEAWELMKKYDSVFHQKYEQFIIVMSNMMTEYRDHATLQSAIAELERIRRNGLSAGNVIWRRNRHGLMVINNTIEIILIYKWQAIET